MGAVSFTAILVLNASPFQMSLIRAASVLPGLVFSLFAGAWMDRLPRRPILIGADVGRAALLGSIPVAFFLGQLRIEYLYTVVFLTGVLTVFFDVAYRSYLPTLVPGSIPVAFFLGQLRIEYLYTVVFLTGVLTVFLATFLGPPHSSTLPTAPTYRPWCQGVSS